MNITKSIVTAVVISCMSFAANGSPPPAGSPSAEDLAPYGDWVRNLKDYRGFGCCDLADCRVAEKYRLTSDGYEVFMDSKVWPGANDKWTKVPDQVVLHGHDNPTGFAVACWADWKLPTNNGFFCFTPASGT